MQEVSAHPAIQFGDWQCVYKELQTLRRTEMDGRQVFLVCAEAADLPGKSLFIDAHSGLVVAEHSLQMLAGVGFVGVQTKYSDFHDVAGLRHTS